MTADKPLGLSQFCYYREGGIFCWGGYLHLAGEPCDPVLMDEQRVPCPLCLGKGQVPTDRGKEILQFLETFQERK